MRALPIVQKVSASDTCLRTGGHLLCPEMAACPCLFFAGNVLLLAQSLTIEEIEVLTVPNSQDFIS